MFIVKDKQIFFVTKLHVEKTLIATAVKKKLETLFKWLKI